MRIVYYILLYFRKPFFMISHFLSTILVMAAIVGYFTSYLSKSYAIGAFVGSIVLFLLRQFYDEILVKINPTGHPTSFDN